MKMADEERLCVLGAMLKDYATILLDIKMLCTRLQIIKLKYETQNLLLKVVAKIAKMEKKWSSCNWFPILNSQDFIEILHNVHKN